MNDPSGNRSSGMALGAGLLAGLLIVIVAAIFYGIYLGLPELDHFFALLLIGSIALILAPVAYLSQAFSRDPVIQRGATLGFLGMGFVVLFLTVAFGPTGDPFPSMLERLGGLIVLALLLVIAGAGIMWRMRGRAADTARQEHRAQWSQSPSPSAFDYPAAQAAPPPPAAVPSPPPSVPPSR
ncbi:MAG: hypothetical protein L3K19_08900 [Thermoplasmata archaeon]|nr:hypothetical protein [Thermoplasmata archaeon]